MRKSALEARYKLLGVLLNTLAIFLIVGGPWLVSGYAPLPLDAREHIFRATYFYQGLFNGDYTPIQYHGYAFLSTYGVAFYAIEYTLFRTISAFGGLAVPNAIYSFDVLLVLVPVFLLYSTLELVLEYRKLTNKEYIIFGLVLASLPTLSVAYVNESMPYLLSFAFSLLALKYIIRLRNGSEGLGTLLEICLFSALSIYAESFGYVFTFVNFLFLLTKPRELGKVLLMTIPATSFSWIQLLETWSFGSPLTAGEPSFLVFYSTYLMLFLLYAYFRRRHEHKGNNVLCKVSLASFLIATAAALAPAFQGALGAIGGFIIPWRFLYVNGMLTLLASIFVDLEGVKPARNDRLELYPLAYRSLVVLVAMFLIASYLAFVFFTIQYLTPLPREGAQSLLTGYRVMIPAKTIYTSNYSGSFALLQNYSTVTGAYNQGDPSFYYITVYYEWMVNFAHSYPSFANMMQLTGANAIVFDKSFGYNPGNAELVDESYGYSVYRLNASLADKVTPILLLSPNTRETVAFTSYINILAYNGFQLIFTQQNSSDVSGVVILPGYNGSYIPASGAKVVRIVNSRARSLDEVNSSYFIMGSDAVNKSETVFPYEPYSATDYLEVRLNQNVSNSTVANATFLSDELRHLFNVTYKPVSATSDNGTYRVGSSTGPVLLKVSYYPYFVTNDSSRYTYNTDHFILLPHGDVTLKWELPFYSESALVSAASMLGLVASIAYLRFWKQTRLPRR